MANPEHVEILKQGVEVWNRWRKKNPEIVPRLQDVDLSGKDLSGIDLWEADLAWSHLSRTNLTEAIIRVGRLRFSDLSGAILAKADLLGADLFMANLKGADLTEAGFAFANLSMADLLESDLRNARFLFTSIGGTNLKNAKNLQNTVHRGSSFIDLSTIFKSEGQIPESFLKGCGIPDSFIQFIPSLVNQGLKYYPCFISYSSKDQDFAERLHADLQNKGVRCWFAPEDIKIGDKIRDRIDQSIRLHDKLLLILSDYSINSDWIEDEVDAAHEQEQSRGKTVLCPIRIDDAVMETDEAWAGKLKRSRHIGDFTNWKDQDSYQQAFDRLLRDLKAEPE